MMLTILIADDSALIRERLAEIISEIDGVNLVGQATTAPEAIALAQHHQPHVVIMDIHMPGGSGIMALQTIKQTTPSRVVMLTAFPYPQYREQCLRLGADGFLSKSDEFDQIAPLLGQMQKEQP